MKAFAEEAPRIWGIGEAVYEVSANVRGIRSVIDSSQIMFRFETLQSDLGSGLDD